MVVVIVVVAVVAVVFAIGDVLVVTGVAVSVVFASLMIFLLCTFVVYVVLTFVRGAIHGCVLVGFRSKMGHFACQSIVETTSRTIGKNRSDLLKCYFTVQ